MGRAIQVPVTPSVLQWAIDESGYSPEDVALAAGADVALLERWVSGHSQPTLTQARKLASKLHRPFAALLLPSPPERQQPRVKFRQPLDRQRSPNPAERRFLRRASRFQEILSWIQAELEAKEPSLPSASTEDDPLPVAVEMRRRLGIPMTDQMKWSSASAAFDEWRLALERVGVLVFLFSLGTDSCHGFSMWDDHAPVIAVNTARSETARIFTLFHEVGHLVTRTSSVCVEAVKAASKTDPVERWCEKFAAEVLLPAKNVLLSLRQAGLQSGQQITNLALPTRIASAYRVSLRATVLRMIDLKIADWTLYEQIPPLSDAKPPGGGGSGRDRTEIREDQLGDRAASVLVAGVERDIIDRSQAVELLDIPDASFDELVRPTHPSE
jgi:Zn-dependent peptidase ImmA (M78 family)